MPVAGFQLLPRQTFGLKHSVPRVVEIPIAVQDSPLSLHPPMQSGARVRREDVKRGGLDALRDGPFYRTAENGFNGNAEVPRGRHEAVLSLELLPELFELPFQILDFFLEFADSIQLNLWFSEPDFTRKEMRITDFFLAALPRQSHNERAFG